MKKNFNKLCTTRILDDSKDYSFRFNTVNYNLIYPYNELYAKIRKWQIIH